MKLSVMGGQIMLDTLLWFLEGGALCLSSDDPASISGNALSGPKIGDTGANGSLAAVFNLRYPQWEDFYQQYATAGNPPAAGPGGLPGFVPNLVASYTGGRPPEILPDPAGALNASTPAAQPAPGAAYVESQLLFIDYQVYPLPQYAPGGALQAQFGVPGNGWVRSAYLNPNMGGDQNLGMGIAGIAAATADGPGQVASVMAISAGVAQTGSNAPPDPELALAFGGYGQVEGGAPGGPGVPGAAYPVSDPSVPIILNKVVIRLPVW